MYQETFWSETDMVQKEHRKICVFANTFIDALFWYMNDAVYLVWEVMQGYNIGEKSANMKEVLFPSMT